MNKIHLDPNGINENMKPIKNLLKKYNAKRYYLPPSSPHLNPIESMFANLKSKLFKK
jgi:transposase